MENAADAPAVTFESFGLRPEVLTVLKGLGYEEPTPIQRETIPALISGKDVLGQAATGTGKTAAFALPMMQLLDPKDRKPFEAQALVLVPTRELAMQVAEAVQKYGAGIGITALAVYGGQEIFTQIKPLKRGVDVVVATPGRALDHIARKSLVLSRVKFVVLDEADEMLDMGFEEDLQAILSELPAQRQTALFSATLPSRIAKIAERHLDSPVRVTIAAKASEAGTLPSIRQSAYVVQRKFKEAALMRVLEWEQPNSAIIFCRTRVEVEELTHVLMRSGYAPAAIHGGLTQEQRDGVLKRFKEGACRVLVATDVAARGLHVENLSHVVNYDLPTSPEVYVHRIGRTGRAGKEGVALSFLDPREMRLLQNVERLMKKKVQQLPVPTRVALDGRRSETVANKVKAAMAAPEVATFMTLAQGAAEGSTMEAVAAAAMYLLQQQLFPAHDSDAVDIPSRPERVAKGERTERAGVRDDRGPRRERLERQSGPRAGMTALTLSLGEKAGVRPQDLVGAIANEANLPSRQISGVRVDEYTSRVEVPEEVVDAVIEALHATKIRGRKVKVEREGAGATRRPAHARSEGHGAESSEQEPRTPRASAPRAPRVSAPRAKKAEAVAETPAPEAAPVQTPRPAREDRPPPGDKPRSADNAKLERTDRPRSGADKPRFGSADKPRFSDKPRFERSDKPRFGGDERPRFSDKPKFERGDKPRFSGDERPKFGADRPRFGNPDKPRFNADKPRFGEGEKPRSFGKFNKDDRPSRFASGARPARGRMEPKKG